MYEEYHITYKRIPNLINKYCFVSDLLTLVITIHQPVCGKKLFQNNKTLPFYFDLFTTPTIRFTK